MTDDAQGNGEAAQERATVRLVSEQIRGLERLTESGFKDLQRQFDSVAGLPVIVAELKADLKALDERERLSDAAMDHRVTGLEDAKTSDHNWRISSRPVILLTAVLALVGIIGLLTQLHIFGG